jgi:hypothetical protein
MAAAQIADATKIPVPDFVLIIIFLLNDSQIRKIKQFFR